MSSESGKPTTPEGEAVRPPPSGQRTQAPERASDGRAGRLRLYVLPMLILVIVGAWVFTRVAVEGLRGEVVALTERLDAQSPPAVPAEQAAIVPPEPPAVRGLRDEIAALTARLEAQEEAVRVAADTLGAVAAGELARRTLEETLAASVQELASIRAETQHLSELAAAQGERIQEAYRRQTQMAERHSQDLLYLRMQRLPR